MKDNGFKKKPHHESCRQKSYDLSKTAGFQSTFNGASQLNFFTSFDNGYDKHRASPVLIRNEGYGNEYPREVPKSTL